MSIKKSIPMDDWSDRLTSFSSGNRGRLSAIATQNMTIVEDKKLEDIVYDPVNKGNDIVIAVEGPEGSFRHIVEGPAELIIEQREDGVVSTLEIIDQNNESTFVRLYD